MKHVYVLQWGFHSSNEGGEYESFWSTKEKADKALMEEVFCRGLEQQRSRKTKELSDIWSDGDYYIYVQQITVDEEL